MSLPIILAKSLVTKASALSAKLTSVTPESGIPINEKRTKNICPGNVLGAKVPYPEINGKKKNKKNKRQKKVGEF